MQARKRKHDQPPECASPRFAILKLRPDTDCVKLFQQALSLGISDISFVSHPREYFLSTDHTTATNNEERQQNGQSGTPIGPSTPPRTSRNSSEGVLVIDDDVIKQERSDSPAPMAVQQTAFDSVMSSIFGNDRVKAERTSTAAEQLAPPSSLQIPRIPGFGQINCIICGVAVSCRKVTNLSSHTLKVHCPVPLWKCPTNCSFEHADFTRVRSHIRHQHPQLIGQEGQPIDNRSEETVNEAHKYLKACFPTVDWDQLHRNVIYQTESSSEKSKERTDPQGTWDRQLARIGQPTVRCTGCNLMVQTNKRFIEDHIFVIHRPEKPFQCGLCDYASLDEWKVRLHGQITHTDRPYVHVYTCQPTNKAHLYVRHFFPEIAAVLPDDEMDVMMGSLRASAAAVNAEPVVPQISTQPQEPEKFVVPMAMDLQPLPVPLPAGTEPAEDSTVHNMLLQMFPSLASLPGGLMGVASPFQKTLTSTAATSRMEKMGGKVDCAMCSVTVEAKRTMLVSHAKSHCPQRQWQCPFCETSAAFHSKLKLHLGNAHKSDAEPWDKYSPDLENKWLFLFRKCFPQFAHQCYVEEWKFRSKQQQHYSSPLEGASNNTNGTPEMTELPNRIILLEQDNDTTEKPEEEAQTA